MPSVWLWRFVLCVLLADELAGNDDSLLQKTGTG